MGVPSIADHPGTILFVDGRTDEITRVAEASAVHPDLRFVDDQPVVRVVAFEDGDQRRVFEYGPGKLLLRSSVQRRVS